MQLENGSTDIHDISAVYWVDEPKFFDRFIIGLKSDNVKERFS
jgi:hypothetical protein